MSKVLVSFDPNQKWCDYELLSQVSSLLEADGRSVHIPLKDFGSIMIVTPAGGYTSLKDLATMMWYIADCLEDTNLYRE